MKVIDGATLDEKTGLLTMQTGDYTTERFVVAHIVPIPSSCCPISKNPKEGSKIKITYSPKGRVCEVYSLRTLLNKFVGGFRGNDHYGPERNMEGMCQLVAQMVADAVGVSVQFEASVILDCGEMSISGEAMPS